MFKSQLSTDVNSNIVFLGGGFRYLYVYPLLGKTEPIELTDTHSLILFK